MHTLNLRNKKLVIGERTLVMGIVNVTPDSFSDGGFFLPKNRAVEHAEFLVNSGADIVDIGGESTRPFADSVSATEEMCRVIPVIEELSGLISVPISVDTTKANVAQEALRAGASIVNDISALSSDSRMAKIVTKYHAGLVLMHIRGTPKNMQLNLVYDNLLAEIKSFLSCSIDKAVATGVDKSSIIIDPGLGFGKTVDHNLEIMRGLNEFLDFKVPILIGSSRKTFIRKTIESRMGICVNPTSTLAETGTQATVAAAVMNGASIVRVHDVASTRATVDIIDAINQA